MIVETLLHYVYDRNFVYQVTVSVTTYFVIRIFQFVRYRQKRHRLFKEYGIPGPEPSFLDGNYGMLRVLDRGRPTMHKIEEQMVKKYGKFYGKFIGDEPSITVCDLDIIKKIFIDDNGSFTERTRLILEDPLSKGILFAKHHRWKVMRKALSPFFSRYTMRGGMSTQFLEDSIKLNIHYIDQKLLEAESSGTKAVIDFHDLMKATSLYIISKMAIKLPNVQVKEGETHVRSLDSYLSTVDKGPLDLIIMFPLIKPVFEFLAHHLEHNKTLSLISRELNRLIDEGLKTLSNEVKSVNEQQHQVIDLMIKLHHEGKLTRDEVLATTESILFAGYDTTSTTLSYIFWVLAKYPNIQERLRDEIIAHGLDSKYLMQVINETMRLYPTVVSFITRLATKIVQIDQWTIPKGTVMVYNNWLVSHDPDLWPDPYVFDPERFRDGADIHPCAHAPFGFGERKCIGYQLAILEIKMVICDILLSYSVKLISPEVLELYSYAVSLTKSRDKIMLEFDKL